MCLPVSVVLVQQSGEGEEKVGEKVLVLGSCWLHLKKPELQLAICNVDVHTQKIIVMQGNILPGKFFQIKIFDWYSLKNLHYCTVKNMKKDIRTFQIPPPSLCCRSPLVHQSPVSSHLPRWVFY